MKVLSEIEFTNGSNGHDRNLTQMRYALIANGNAFIQDHTSLNIPFPKTWKWPNLIQLFVKRHWKYVLCQTDALAISFKNVCPFYKRMQMVGCRINKYQSKMKLLPLYCALSAYKSLQAYVQTKHILRRKVMAAMTWHLTTIAWQAHIRNYLGLALLTLSWDKNWDIYSLVKGYPIFYPRITLVAPSPGRLLLVALVLQIRFLFLISLFEPEHVLFNYQWPFH